MAYQDIQEMYEKWEDRMQHHGIGNMPFCIAFCGVFSSGKSSLLNALLGCGDVLPTGINPVTKIITRIRYGKKQSLKCISNGKEVSIPDNLMKATIIGERPLPHGCTEIILELPAEILKNNVEFIDTPGYEDNSALEDMSRAAVLTADLIVFCCNSTMLGKQFEKQYLDELHLTHGNFCMVANRMDSLNTDEDIENVRRMAQRLMSGRGNAAHPGNKQGQFFLTIAAGPYTKIPGFDHMNGFDKFIQKLTEDETERKAIRQSTNECFTRYYKDRILKGIKAEREDSSAEIRRLQIADNAAKEKVELQNKLNRSRVENKVESAKLYGSSLVKQKKTSIENRIRSFNSTSIFVESVKSVVRNEVSDMIGTLGSYSYKNDLVAGTRIRSELNQFLLCHVPEPTYRKVQKRGLFGRVIQSVVDTIDMGELWIDDGMEYVTNDYKTPAINKVNGHLDNFLQRWNKLLNDFKSQQIGKNTAFTPNPRIAEIQVDIKKLDELEAKMNSQEKLITVLETQSDPIETVEYITEEIEQFCKSIMQLPGTANMCRSLRGMQDNWKNGAVKVVFEGGYACGKSTLIDAVLGADISIGMAEGSSPVNIITCQPEEKVVISNESKSKKTEMCYSEYLASRYDRIYDPNEEVTFYTKARGLGSPMIALVDNFVYHEIGNEIIRKNRMYADVFVFVVTAKRGFSRDDRAFFQDLYERFDNVFVVFTMMDALGNHEEEKELKKELAHILSPTKKGFSEKFMQERVFFTKGYVERCVQQGKDIFAGGMYIPAKMIKTGIPELRTALNDYINKNVLDSKYILMRAHPVFKYMCQVYGTLFQRFCCVNSQLSKAYNNLNNLHMIMYGEPLTDKRRLEIANGK